VPGWGVGGGVLGGGWGVGVGGGVEWELRCGGLLALVVRGRWGRPKVGGASVCREGVGSWCVVVVMGGWGLCGGGSGVVAGGVVSRRDTEVIVSY